MFVAGLSCGAESVGGDHLLAFASVPRNFNTGVRTDSTDARTYNAYKRNKNIKFREKRASVEPDNNDVIPAKKAPPWATFWNQ